MFDLPRSLLCCEDQAKWVGVNVKSESCTRRALNPLNCDCLLSAVFIVCGMKVLEACGWKLRHLDISDCTRITDQSLENVGERCGLLESFNLGMCPLLSGVAIREVMTTHDRVYPPLLCSFCFVFPLGDAF